MDHAAHQGISAALQGGCFRQYTLASFLGSRPGCLGALMNVSLCVHGIISFGAIVVGMIATSRDEAFVMLFFCTVIFARVSDKLVHMFHLTPRFQLDSKDIPCSENVQVFLN